MLMKLPVECHICNLMNKLFMDILQEKKGVESFFKRTNQKKHLNKGLNKDYSLKSR